MKYTHISHNYLVFFPWIRQWYSSTGDFFFKCHKNLILIIDDMWKWGGKSKVGGLIALIWFEPVIPLEFYYYMWEKLSLKSQTWILSFLFIQFISTNYSSLCSGFRLVGRDVMNTKDGQNESFAFNWVLNQGRWIGT